MSPYTLDTNVLVDVAREPDGPVGRRFYAKQPGEMGLSVIAAGEVQLGIEKHPQSRSNPSMRYLLGSLRIEALAPEVSETYGRVRLAVERSGRSMSPNDYWIVAHALAKDAVLVTGDRAIHDAGVVGLKVEDWRGELAVRKQD
ncbi:MAG: VapC toxin family PIN domain ribonuclease [Mesorhizobium amorphae]|nr:MAG: VapC toxin family PIN domain ribonuclease [Mesorhizobium amorphae]